MDNQLIQVIDDLYLLMEKNPKIENELKNAIKKADINHIKTINDFIHFLKNKKEYYPRGESILNDHSAKFFYIINQSDYLNKNVEFDNWIKKFTKQYGIFLDSPESAVYLKELSKDPSFDVGDYYPGPSGWLTFNQFFARSIRPGRRPIEALCDNNVVVSPVDGTFMYWQEIRYATVRAKGIEFSLEDLLKDSEYSNNFKNGIFALIHLGLYNYHHFHTAVSGKIVEIKKIPGHIHLDVIKQKNGLLKVVDGEKIHIDQDRGIMIMETNIGLVAIVCLGVEFISSVNLLPDNGSYLYKGQDFGYFAYGGSDVIMLFENRNVKFTAINKSTYHQGNAIAIVE